MTQSSARFIRNVSLLVTRDGACSFNAIVGVRKWADVAGNWHCRGADPVMDSLPRLERSRPDGIIADFRNNAVAAAVQALNVPTVDVSSWLEAPFPRVRVDDIAIGRLAAQHLLERGLRQFAFVGDLRRPWANLRFRGFSEDLAGADFQPLLFDYGACPDEPDLYTWPVRNERLHHWLKELPHPLGVLAANDRWGLCVLDTCLDLGFRSPDRVAVIGVDDEAMLCELARPKLSSVENSAERVGYEAATLLDDMMNGKPAPTEPIIVPPGGVRARQSTDMLAVEDTDVADAIRFIRAHAALGVSVQDVAADVPVPRRSLERRFRKATGVGMHDEIQRVRYEKAAELLRSTNLPIPTVARKAGFSSNERLARVFRQRGKVTPLQYRRQYRIAD